MQQSGAKAYLVNTGWNGTGKRISIKDTRGIIDAILNGDILNAPTKKIPYFNFEVPTELNGVDTGILDPRDTYADPSEWDARQRIWLDVSSRTSRSTKATQPARHWFPLVLSCKIRYPDCVNYIIGNIFEDSRTPAAGFPAAGVFLCSPFLCSLSLFFLLLCPLLLFFRGSRKCGFRQFLHISIHLRHFLQVFQQGFAPFPHILIGRVKISRIPGIRNVSGMPGKI